MWFSPLKEALDTFFNHVQQTVSGTVRMRLYKGQATVVGLKSPKSIYNEDLATYTDADSFDHGASVGFIKIWGTSVKTWRQVHPFPEEKMQPPKDALKIVEEGA
jgi:argininosuccinate synthase